jgi:hypothetical protein
MKIKDLTNIEAELGFRNSNNSVFRFYQANCV